VRALSATLSLTLCLSDVCRVDFLSMQRSYPCCEGMEFAIDWTKMWMDTDAFAVWMHPKDLKYAHNLEFTEDAPLHYAPLVEGD
jgi:hypothetical protein